MKAETAKAIDAILAKGHDCEVRNGPNGTVIVISVKKKITAKV